MKLGMMRWKITLSYLWVAARVAKLRHVRGAWSLYSAMVMSPREVARRTPLAAEEEPVLVAEVDCAVEELG